MKVALSYGAVLQQHFTYHIYGFHESVFKWWGPVLVVWAAINYVLLIDFNFIVAPRPSRNRMLLRLLLVRQATAQYYVSLLCWQRKMRHLQKTRCDISTAVNHSVTCKCYSIQVLLFAFSKFSMLFTEKSTSQTLRCVDTTNHRRTPHKCQ